MSMPRLTPVTKSSGEPTPSRCRGLSFGNSGVTWRSISHNIAFGSPTESPPTAIPANGMFPMTCALYRRSSGFFFQAEDGIRDGTVTGVQKCALPICPELTAWIVINPDSSVVIRVARSEMGQGSSTGLAMLVAEELECDWRKVRTEFVSTNEQLRRNRAWGSMATGGSRSIRDSQEYLRRAGATAREMLVAAAAQRWKVPGSECDAENGAIIHRPSQRKLRFGQVAQAASKLEPPGEVKLKDPKDWNLIGKPAPRLDISDKVTGKQLFSIDVQLLGM